MTGEKRSQKGHDTLLNVHSILHLRRITPPRRTPRWRPASCPALGLGRAETQTRGRPPEGRLTHQPDFHLLSISLGAFGIFGK